MGESHLAAGRLDATELDAAEEAHVRVCAQCRVDRRRMAAFATFMSEGADSAPSLDTAEELPPGTLIDGKYIVGHLLGRGGMGTVYLVRHAVLGSEHALKLLNMPNPALGARLLREGQLQARLEHSNIVRVTDAVRLGESSIALVMEYVRGPTLDRLISEGGITTWAQRDAIAIGILRGAGAAHQLGWVHRDLKPANVLLVEEDDGFVPKIADFGLARVIADAGSLTRSGMILGTALYMAPEQFRDSASVDARADVFALGAILYELCAGRRPFNGATLTEIAWQVQNRSFVPPRALVPDLPERMERAILAALEPDRDRRVASARLLLQLWRGRDAEVALDSGSLVQRSGRAVSPARDLRVLIGLVVGTGAVALGLAAALSGEAPSRPAEAPAAPATQEVSAAPLGPASEASAAAPPPRDDSRLAAAAPAPGPRVKREVRTAEPAPEPVVAPLPTIGAVRVTGNARAVRLRRDGQDHPPGELSPGSYQVVADFQSGGERALDERVEVQAGMVVELKCESRMSDCRVIRRSPLSAAD